MLSRSTFAAIVSQLIMYSLDPGVAGLREPLLLPAESRGMVVIVVDNLCAAVQGTPPFLWRALDPVVLDLLLQLHILEGLDVAPVSLAGRLALGA